jgi:predicted AAA+ superfamily ATPase
MFPRIIEPRLRAARKSLLLLGARQVGKSTLARSLAPDVTINLADEATFQGYAKDVGRLGREVRALGRPSVIFIDEVQRIPSLLNTVQALLDEDRALRFVLTGSSARKLRRGGANLLPGRIVLEHLDPLSVWEIGEDFSLDRALQIGTLPGIYAEPSGAEDLLSTYATVYLREEVQAEAMVRDIGSYARFLDLAAGESGRWVNYSKLASDAEIPKETLRRYYQLLEDTLLAFRIEAYRPRRAVRRISQRDRFVLFDLGVRNALLGVHRHPASATERGSLFEQWVILQCLYFIHAHRLPWRVVAYRTDAGAEVDAILDTGERLLALECKLGRHVGASDLRGLRSFAEVAERPVSAFVLFQGERAQSLDHGIRAVPYLDFLMTELPRLARG